jgi:hypothetical protein
MNKAGNKTDPDQTSTGSAKRPSDAGTISTPSPRPSVPRRRLAARHVEDGVTVLERSARDHTIRRSDGSRAPPSGRCRQPVPTNRYGPVHKPEKTAIDPGGGCEVHTGLTPAAQAALSRRDGAGVARSDGDSRRPESLPHRSAPRGSRAPQGRPSFGAPIAAPSCARSV